MLKLSFIPARSFDHLLFPEYDTESFYNNVPELAPAVEGRDSSFKAAQVLRARRWKGLLGKRRPDSQHNRNRRSPILS